MKIAFLYPGETLQSWAKNDLLILQNNHDVMLLNGRNSLYFYTHIYSAIKKCDVVFIWFFEYRALVAIIIAKLLHKKTIVVVGGGDLENVPEIGYGNLRNPFMKLTVGVGLDIATHVLPFSNYACRLAKAVMMERDNIEVVNLACDTDYFKPNLSIAKEPIIITVGRIDAINIKRKGFDTFVEVARLLPNYQFYVIGRLVDVAASELKIKAPSNCHFLGFVTKEDLLKIYQMAKVFCLLSYLEGEGGGGVTGESMSCECVPVVAYKAEALRETVSDTGFYTSYGDVKETALVIERALQSDLGRSARQRIIDNYSMKLRTKKLEEIMGS